jgi:hypothetical protein
VAEVFAGFVAGYGLALITSPILAFLMFRVRARSDLLMRIFPSDAPMVAVTMLIHGALTFVLTALGIVLGLVLLAMEDADGAVGSLNWPFTLFVAALTLAGVAPIFALLRPFRRAIAAYSLLFVAIYGWLMPYLADWSKFN